MKDIVEHIELATIHDCLCDKHEGEEYKYYCQTCETPTCKDCTIQDHREHEYCAIKDVVEDFRKSLAEKLGKLRERKAHLGDDISNFEKLEESFKTTNEQVQVEINQHFDKLVKTVESQRQKLIAKANEITESKLQTTGMKIDDLRLKQTFVESNIYDVETRFDDLKDEEVLMKEKRISEEPENMQFGNEYEQRSVHNDMKVFVLKSAEDFEKSLIQSCLVANSNVCPENCTSSLEPPKLKKDEQAVITVTCKDKTNRDIKHGGQAVKAEFSGNATVREVSHIDHKDGTHDIIVVPKTQGVVGVKIYINGQEAPKCMFETTVRRDSKIFH